MTDSHIDVVFVLPTLNAGGAERVISLVAKNISRNDFNVTLIIVGYEKDKVYDVEGVNVIFFNKPRVRNGIPKLFKYIRIAKPDIILSCMGHLNTTLALILLIFPKIKLIHRQTNLKNTSPSERLPKQSVFKNIINKITIRQTDAVICQSEDMANELMSRFNIPQSKITVINNPISDGFELLSGAPKNNPLKTFITVGRLVEVKGHLRVLNVLSKLQSPFRYIIIGAGLYEEIIKDYAKKLNLEEDIEFIRYTKKVPRYLRSSDIFLQGSFSEGFPNALLESCAVGTPVIAFQAIGGTNEIVQHGVNGYIAKDENEFLQYLIKMIKNPLSPKTVSASVFAKFHKGKIIKNYEDLIKKTAHH